jgi:hypothetical protein
MSKLTTAHKLVIVSEHRRRGKRVKQHIRRIPQTLKPPYVRDTQSGAGGMSAGYGMFGGSPTGGLD